MFGQSTHIHTLSLFLAHCRYNTHTPISALFPSLTLSLSHSNPCTVILNLLSLTISLSVSLSLFDFETPKGTERSHKRTLSLTLIEHIETERGKNTISCFFFHSLSLCFIITISVSFPFCPVLFSLFLSYLSLTVFLSFFISFSFDLFLFLRLSHSFANFSISVSRCCHHFLSFSSHSALCFHLIFSP